MAFSFYLEPDTFCNLVESLLLFVASVFLCKVLLSTVKQSIKSITGLKWLIPFSIFILIELVDEVIYTFYLLTQNYEPELVSTITDITDVIAYAALLYAMIGFWHTIRDGRYLVSSQPTNQQVSESIEGVWPPPPNRPF